ncbi:hypothetical protein [Streptomyces purpurascens]|uniref:hypothetical protein n=1 Tax=Streptomyces purpurascens TaxID=1924 RepID=UPI001677EE68|nr:hypothetical protein [Streptomyces purpurascens]MCE7051933.1 hypothetical protein [Streptomyces purpurascens]GHA58996.1 hypothetical protein GCM10010303_83240 [Streptomyces purpurascens]
MAVTVVNVDEWLDEITAQARSSQSRVFSVSVPVNHPEIASHAYEQLLSEAIAGVERQGWKLESMSTYGTAGGVYDSHPRFWALLVFRTLHHGRF